MEMPALGRGESRLGGIALGLAMAAGLGCAAYGQAAAGGVQKTCKVGPAPNEADTALFERHYAEAAQLYAAMPASSEATAGTVRAMVGEHRFKEALELAQRESAAHPDDALLLDVLGEVRYRRGEIADAESAYTRSLKLDFCLGRTHYDMARFQEFGGLAKTAQKNLETAHTLAPLDPTITRAWKSSHLVSPTAAEQLAALKTALARPGLSEERKAETQHVIDLVTARSNGDCTLTTQVETAKVPLYPMGGANSGLVQGMGVDLQLNGKRKRLVLDTGASGLALTREAAKALGITAEATSKAGGLGDGGLREVILAHVDEIKVGSMVFRNCRVEIFEAKSVLPGEDGLIGADVFRNFLVTLDFPAREIRLGPLPPRPDETAQTPTLGTEEEQAAAGTDPAAAKRDRYISPAMKDWTPIFRADHFLILPTRIGKAPVKLFMMDTGSSRNMISPDAAREVTSVGADDSIRLHGISGEVKNVFSTGPMSIRFANVMQQTMGLISIDTSGFAGSTGTEISGFIGFETLQQLSISIDYRDNLMKATYTPHIGGTGR